MLYDRSLGTDRGEDSDVTPADLRAMRLRLGLQPSELADLLDMGGRRDIVENLEKSRTRNMFERHRDILEEMERDFREALDDLADSSHPRVIVTYPNDGVFEKFDPDGFARWKFATVHRTLMSRYQEILGEDGVVVPMLDLIPAKLERWLDGKPATPGNVEAWAHEFVTVGENGHPFYKIRPGLPSPGNPEG